MRIKLPSHPSQVPLHMYVAFKSATTDIERVQSVTGLSAKQVGGLKLETVAEIISTFELAAQAGHELNRHVVVRKRARRIRLSLLPDFTTMTLAEHIDMDSLADLIWKQGQWSELPRLMAIMYRPLTAKMFGQYSVAKYDSNNVPHHAVIGQLSMADVNGALLFFSTIAKALRTNSIESSLTHLRNQVKTIEGAKH